MEAAGNRITRCIVPGGGNNGVVGNQFLVRQILATYFAIGNIAGQAFVRMFPELVRQFAKVLVDILDGIEDRQRVIGNTLHFGIIASKKFVR